MPCTAGISSAASMPMPWPTGAPTIAGGAFVGCADESWRTSKPIVRCVCTTPFGSDVVPDVYAMSAGLAASTGAGPSSGPAPNHASSASKPAGSSPTTATSSGNGAPHASKVAVPLNAPNRSKVTNAFGGVLRRM